LNQRLIPEKPTASGGETYREMQPDLERVDERMKLNLTEAPMATELEEIDMPTGELEEMDMQMEELEEIIAKAKANNMDGIPDCPETPTSKEIPPGSLLSDWMRPPSPTNITDFPYFEPWEMESGDTAVPVRARTTTLLPRVLADDETNQFTTACLRLEDNIEELREMISPVVRTYNVMAGIRT
jgi:hypothetical protein